MDTREMEKRNGKEKWKREMEKRNGKEKWKREMDRFLFEIHFGCG
jgi:hypothetical protein